MSNTDAIVYVVDDDVAVRKATARLFRSVGLQVETFPTAREFLDHRRAVKCGCLVLDLQLPGLSGIELQQELIANNVDLPIVFMTGHGDIPTTVEAMKLGAIDFLPKPVDTKKLVDTVRDAINEHDRTRQQCAELQAFRERVETLTKREYEVMLLVITGLLNKKIALRLKITETTVKVHRGRVMEKTGVDSAAKLVLLCERAGFTPTSD